MTTATSTTLALLEEHVRQFLNIMGFSQTTIRCRIVAASPAAAVPVVDEALFRNAALEVAPSGPPRPLADTRARLLIDIEAGEEGRLLIGAHGAHLEALQHVVRNLLRQHFQEPLHITVDVNGYRLRREEEIIQLAQAGAARAVTTRRAVELRPMSASDRRAVHAALADRSDIRTESQGTDPHRYVVIRPVT